MEPSEPKNEINEIKEESNNPEKKEEKTENNQIEKKEEQQPQIQTFELGDERHPVDPEAEEIEYIGERIKALEHLEKCTKLKKLLLRRNVIKKIEIKKIIIKTKCHKENRKHISFNSIERIRIIR